MKSNKAHKRITKVEVLISDLVNRYSAGAAHVAQVLEDAKAAVSRAKEAIGLEALALKPKKTAVARKPVKKATAKKTAKVREKSGIKEAGGGTVTAPKRRPSDKRRSRQEKRT